MTKKAQVHALASMPRPEVALREAAEALAAICAMIDAGEADPRSATVKALFDVAKGGLAISVDGAIDFKRGLDQEEAKAVAALSFWKARKQMIVAMRDAFDEKLISTMTENPDVPYRGSLEEFAVRTNPPAVELAWGDARLTEKLIDDHGICLAYVRPKVSYEIDKVAVAADLKKGVELPWAKLRQGKRVETK